MQQQAGLYFFGKNKLEMHSCTSLHICQPKQLSISSLQMASEAAEVKKGLGQEANDMHFQLVLYTRGVSGGTFMVAVPVISEVMGKCCHFGHTVKDTELTVSQAA